MKEATGELNMTVVTLIAIAAVAALFYFAIWPMIQRMLVQQTCNTYGTGYTAVKVGKTTGEDGTVTGSDTTAGETNGGATVFKWACCANGTTTYVADKCIPAD